MPAAAAGFFFELDRADRHAAVDAFAHVVDGERGDGYGCERFHLDAGFSFNLDCRVDCIVRCCRRSRSRLSRIPAAGYGTTGSVLPCAWPP